MTSNNNDSPIRVQVEAKDSPNLAKLARALIKLAQAEARREQEAQEAAADLDDNGGASGEEVA